MDALQKQKRIIIHYSILLAIPLSIVTWILFDWQSALGIWIGMALGLIGYRMIIAMTTSLTMEDSEAKGRSGYLARYAFYGIALAIMTMLGIPTLAMLAGFMAHKASLLIYASKERTGFHGRTGKRN